MQLGLAGLLNARLVRPVEPIAPPAIVVAVRLCIEHVLSVTQRHVPVDLVLRPRDADSSERVAAHRVRVNLVQVGKNEVDADLVVRYEVVDNYVVGAVANLDASAAV